MWVRSALVTAAFWLIHTSASAAPAVRVEGSETHCPERAAVEREIREFTVEPRLDEPHYRFAISQLPRGARADLFSPDGERLFTRRIESQDCQALARAFALILRAQFVDLGIVESHPEPEPEPEPVAPEQPPPPEPTAKAPTPPPEVERPPPRRAPTDSLAWGYRIAAGAGVGYDLPDASPMLAGVLQAGMVSPGNLWIGLHVRSASPVRVGARPNRVERWPFGFELGVSDRFFRTWWVEPAISAGVLVSRVRALDIDAGARLSPLPVARAALRGGRAFSNVSPWLELGGQLYLDRDRYVVHPRGAVGLGPRATLSLLLGVDIGWF